MIAFVEHKDQTYLTLDEHLPSAIRVKVDFEQRNQTVPNTEELWTRE